MSAEVLGEIPSTLVGETVKPTTVRTPRGATLGRYGTSFSLPVGENAYRASCELYDSRNPGVVARSFDMLPVVESLDRASTQQLFGAYVPDVAQGTLYRYRVSGRNVFDRDEPDKKIPPFDVYDSSSPVIDTYGRAVHQIGDEFYNVIVGDKFDWQGDRSPRHTDKVICELHVKDYTKLLEELPENVRGTYKGLGMIAAKIKDMGYTHVELMPIFQFAPMKDVLGTMKTDHWGYNPLNFFSPHEGYASDKTPGGSVPEFKWMVRELHKHDIGIILDVVYNHTGEAGIGGPTVSFKGVDNEGYYMYDRYNNNPIDTNGCATNFNANSPQGSALIVESLRYWAEEMHVDGFRFDLAKSLVNQAAHRGTYIDTKNFGSTPIIRAINRTKELEGKTLIAEAWDSNGEINGRLGYFAAAGAWQEWNGFYRDDVRDIILGQEYVRGQSAIQRLSELVTGMKMPQGVVNFLTAHDGFTGWDLVSYSQKHNEANGEGNRDGTDNNHSYNHGIEGTTDSQDVLHARLRTLRNGLAITTLSNGVVMILQGDDRLHSKGGNNNTYCQDNLTSWLQWSGLSVTQRHQMDFMKAALNYRRVQPQFYAGNSPVRRLVKANMWNAADHEWLGESGEPMQDHEWDAKAVGLFRFGNKFGSRVDDAFVVHNVGREQKTFVLPKEKAFKGVYSLVMDTAQGIASANARLEPVIRDSITVSALSTVVLRRRR